MIQLNEWLKTCVTWLKTCITVILHAFVSVPIFLQFLNMTSDKFIICFDTTENRIHFAVSVDSL